MIKFHLTGKKRTIIQIRQIRKYYIWLHKLKKPRNWTNKYIHFQRIYGLGEGQLGFIKNIANITGVVNILNFVKLYFPEYASNFLSVTPIIVISYIVIGYMMGTILDKKLKMVDKVRGWDNKRDPATREILHRLRRLDRGKVN